MPWYLSTMASNKDDKLSPPKKADAASAPDVVQVELDGPGVAPASVDAIALLRVAESYLWLVSRPGSHPQRARDAHRDRNHRQVRGGSDMAD